MNFFYSRHRLSLLLSAFAYVFLPPFAYALRFRLIAPVYFFAGDAFYYLDIARHSIRNPGFSFDGEHPTNGFIPCGNTSL